RCRRAATPHHPGCRPLAPTGRCGRGFRAVSSRPGGRVSRRGRPRDAPLALRAGGKGRRHCVGGRYASEAGSASTGFEERGQL
ncbi:hypothetical protein LTS02_018295, partial [Friedmanniomyces endolithicus]